MNVCMIGAGRLGLANAVHIASKGHDVICVDINEDTVNSINSQVAPNDEPGVQELLTRYPVKARMDLIGSVAQSDIVIVLVNTTPLHEGEYDMRAINEIAPQIGEAVKIGKTHTVVMTSTVGIGETRKFAQTVRDSEPELLVVYSPEFVWQGDVLGCCDSPDVVLIGSDQDPTPFIEFKDSITSNKPQLKIMNWESAEAAKAFLNVALCWRIQFANETAWALQCERHINARHVMDAITSDPRIGRSFMNIGMEPGGPCLPVDLEYAANYAMGSMFDTAMPFAALDSLQIQRDNLALFVEQEARMLGAQTIGLVGMAYKPGVSMTINSPSIHLKERLEKHFEVVTYDPLAPADTDDLDELDADLFVVCVYDETANYIKQPVVDLTGKVLRLFREENGYKTITFGVNQ